MASFEEVGPRSPVTEATRVDRIKPRARLVRNIRALVVILLALFLLFPVLVMGMTAFKSRSDVIGVVDGNTSGLVGKHAYGCQ